jgi:hypothetical protein
MASSDWRDFSSIFNSLDVSHKSMRTGPGVTRSAAWQSRARNRDSAPAASSNSASASPHTIAPAPPRAHGVLSLERMDTDEQIEAAIALSLQDLDATSPSPFAPPPPPSSEPVRSAAAAARPPAPESAESAPDSVLVCPLHGHACTSGPFADRMDLRLHVNVALDHGEAETVQVQRSVIRARARAPSFVGVGM